ncbi:MAG: sel1 repeat family protein [Desulfobacterales bacterium]|nr:sel1 repeat family protein [Desulfobacterales bacterium]
MIPPFSRQVFHVLSHLRFLFTLLPLFMLTILIIGAGRSEAQPKSIQALKNQARRLYWGIGVEQNFTQALSLYETAAALGDGEASFIAGGMYYTGKGAEKSDVKAFEYLSFAVAEGNAPPEALRVLAEFYLKGQVTPQNYSKAMQWFHQAANKGDALSQNELGFLYSQGKGVEQNSEKAYDWFREAALQGSAIAQYNVGIIWYTGDGVAESDLKQAYAWFSVAALNKYGAAILARDFVMSLLSEEELQQAQNLAEDIYGELNPIIPLPPN